MTCRTSSLERALRADLHHAAVLACRGHHLPALPDVVGERLFHVDVLAGLARPYGRQGVPVVGRGDGDRIDLLVVERLAEVGVGGNALVAILELADLVVENLAVDVAQGHDSHAGHLPEVVDELAATTADSARRFDPAESDHGQADFAVGARGLRVPRAEVDHRRHSERQPAGDGSLQDLSARDSFHRLASVQ